MSQQQWGGPPVRATPRRSTSRLPVVRPVWFSSWLAGAARHAGWWRLLPGIPAPRLRSAVLRRRSATVRPDTAYACAAQEESAPVLVAGDHHPGTLATIVGLAISGLTSAQAQLLDRAYQNDDYQVPPPDTNPPPIPLPQTYEQAEQWITNSPFYSQTVPVPVRCSSQPINVTTASDAQLKSHFEGLMECLVRVWEPPVTNAGFIIVRPTVTIYGKELTTKCGKTGVNAFYCTADQQVYYSNLLPQALPSDGAEQQVDRRYRDGA